MNHAYRNDPPNPHVHWWGVPRYNHAVVIDEWVFEDPQFGNPYDHYRWIKSSSRNLAKNCPTDTTSYLDQRATMSKKKKQYYIVVNGRKPGIYNEWFGQGGAADQVEGYPKAIYKGFHTLENAIGWLKESSAETLATLPPDLADLLTFPEIGPTHAESIEAILETGRVVIYADGGADPNPGPGGYGVVLRYQEHRKELSGGFRLTTNNRMELLACIEGLRALSKKCAVVLYSDSRYIVDSVMQGRARRWQANGWQRDKTFQARNVDLWEQLLELCEQHSVEFKWIRGHAGIPDNERCDQLATKAARRRDLPPDVAFEKSCQP
jgi:ribonuclease HI